MTQNWLITFMSPFKKLQRQSTTFSKDTNVVTINRGIGQHGRNIISNLLCRENIVMLQRKRTSSLRITKRCSIGCQRYWDDVLQVSISNFRLIRYLME